MFGWQKWENGGVHPADYCSQLLQTAIGDLSFCMNRARGLLVLKQARRFWYISDRRVMAAIFSSS